MNFQHLTSTQISQRREITGKFLKNKNLLSRQDYALFLLTSALGSAGDIFILEKIQEHASPGAAGLISAALPYNPIQDHRRQHPLRRIRKTK